MVESTRLIKNVWKHFGIFTLNCPGVSRLLRFGQEAILSSSVWRKTLWKSNNSGRLPNNASICRRDAAVRNTNNELKFIRLKVRLCLPHLYWGTSPSAAESGRCQTDGPGPDRDISLTLVLLLNTEAKGFTEGKEITTVTQKKSHGLKHSNRKFLRIKVPISQKAF